MRPLLQTWVSVTALALMSVGTSLAVGVDVSWDDCVTGVGLNNKNFSCSGTAEDGTSE